jgi:hypothetical protein
MMVQEAGFVSTCYCVVLPTYFNLLFFSLLSELHWSKCESSLTMTRHFAVCEVDLDGEAS